VCQTHPEARSTAIARTERAPETSSTLPPRPKISGNSPSSSQCQNQLRREESQARATPPIIETAPNSPQTFSPKSADSGPSRFGRSHEVAPFAAGFQTNWKLLVWRAVGATPAIRID
jgi:hypothetical protein